MSLGLDPTIPPSPLNVPSPAGFSHAGSLAMERMFPSRRRLVTRRYPLIVANTIDSSGVMVIQHSSDGLPILVSARTTGPVAISPEESSVARDRPSAVA